MGGLGSLFLQNKKRLRPFRTGLSCHIHRLPHPDVHHVPSGLQTWSSCEVKGIPDVGLPCDWWPRPLEGQLCRSPFFLVENPFPGPRGRPRAFWAQKGSMAEKRMTRAGAPPAQQRTFGAEIQMGGVSTKGIGVEVVGETTLGRAGPEKQRGFLFAFFVCSFVCFLLAFWPRCCFFAFICFSMHFVVSLVCVAGAGSGIH